jgi:hypothetical protein
MFKAKLMRIFKDMFGGSYSKENGKIFWSKDGRLKELVTTGFLKHFIDIKKDPSVNDQSTIVSKTVSTVVSEIVSTVKQAPTKKAKKNVKPTTNPEVSEGS